MGLLASLKFPPYPLLRVALRAGGWDGAQARSSPSLWCGLQDWTSTSGAGLLLRGSSPCAITRFLGPQLMADDGSGDGSREGGATAVSG